jgi:hypothetical protein
MLASFDFGTACWAEIDLSAVGLNWLGDRDSNPDRQIQNLQSYHWTISQQGLLYLSSPTGFVNCPPIACPPHREHNT